MNFLAHALLGGDDPALVVGGVAGDWIKGPLPAGLPPDLARGVALHRAIDSHAERHPAFRRSRARVSASRRRYAGVLVDIFYDHLLASEWTSLQHGPLAEFAAGLYRQVEDRLADLPPASRYPLKLMAEQDWLSSYAGIDGIADVLLRMSRRARQPNPLAGGEDELHGRVPEFRNDFDEWLGAAREFSAAWQDRTTGAN
jgi:acyl carrier protein phosphodiesterase